jgi:hypothetical protein
MWHDYMSNMSYLTFQLGAFNVYTVAYWYTLLYIFLMEVTARGENR